MSTIYRQIAEKINGQIQYMKENCRFPDGVLFMKRISSNGAISVVIVRRGIIGYEVVKKDIIKKYGLTIEQLPNLNEIKPLWKMYQRQYEETRQKIKNISNNSYQFWSFSLYEQRRENYENYLGSKEWRDKRNECFAIHGKTCVVCKSKPATEVHHLNYETLGDEDAKNDIIPICYECHRKEHGDRQ